VIANALFIAFYASFAVQHFAGPHGVDRPDTSRTPGQSRLALAGHRQSCRPRPSPNISDRRSAPYPSSEREKEKTMTTTRRTATSAASLPTTAAAIFAFLGLIDIKLLGIVGSSIAPSLAVSIVVAVLGLVMLVALTPARNGSRPTLVTAITARVISAVLAVAAFFADAPAWIMAVETFLIAATLIAVVLLRREPRLQGA
jgi:hypothetical protein